VSESLDRMVRHEGGRVLATLVRLTGDIALAEDAVQDAVEQALRRWPIDGVPDNAGAWLTTVARRRALDVLRREAKRTAKESDAVMLDQVSTAMSEVTSDSMVRDDLLRLIFTCCHPALSPEARVALTLRILCGMSTVEIARVFLVADATMGQRISRAKQKIATACIPYRVPSDHELPDRLPAVLAVVYAVVTAGHHAPEGRLDARFDLADEGIRLARLVRGLMPDEPECAGLLALALATNARREARLDEAGELVLLRDQDRTRWRHDEIQEAAELVDAAIRRRRVGQFQLQAAIACLHSLAPSADETDWPQIAELYRMLESLTPSPVVRVNRAVAEAEVNGAAVGLALLEAMDQSDVEQWHLFWSTRAELLLRMGDVEGAVTAFDRALTCTPNESDRRFLERRASELTC
jgi:RNA polymerase sigma-70 factor (ECF subfamily)